MPQTFTDNTGTTHEMIVDVNTLKRVRRHFDINLLDLAQTRELPERLANDPILMIDLIYVVANPQQQTDEEFGAALVGDAVEAALDALLEAIIGFFHKQKRTRMQHAHAKLKTAEEQANKRLDAILDSPAFEAEMTDLVEADINMLEQRLKKSSSRPMNSGNSSTKPPASSSSTPDP